MDNPQRSPRGFWADLPEGFLCLAPMADVTDYPFRQIFAQCGRPDITWTEFVSADGLFLRPVEEGVGDVAETSFHEILKNHHIGTDHPLARDLIFSENERPIVAQFFSRDPERMFRAARLARDLGYDGVDINMGCPADVICRQGAGSAMIKDPALAQEIIQASIEGAGGLPVSVKTRIGYNENQIETWLPALLAAQPVAVILHGRTRKEMSKVEAHWDVIARAVEIRDQLAPDILIVGNGDVKSASDARERMTEARCDGVMIGRGIFGNPWFFNEDTPKASLSPETIVNTLIQHIHLFDEHLAEIKNFAIMKKHYKAYLRDLPGGKELYMRMVNETRDAADAIAILNEYLEN